MLTCFISTGFGILCQPALSQVSVTKTGPDGNTVNKTIDGTAQRCCYADEFTSTYLCSVIAILFDKPVLHQLGEDTITRQNQR